MANPRKDLNVKVNLSTSKKCHYHSIHQVLHSPPTCCFDLPGMLQWTKASHKLSIELSKISKKMSEIFAFDSQIIWIINSAFQSFTLHTNDLHHTFPWPCISIPNFHTIHRKLKSERGKCNDDILLFIFVSPREHNSKIQPYRPFLYGNLVVVQIGTIFHTVLIWCGQLTFDSLW